MKDMNILEVAGGKPILLVAAVGLIDPDNRVLLARRPEGKPLAGLWEFPGGKCEPGESYPDALRRELREELGIEVTVGRCFDTVDHAYPDRTVHLEFYLCRWEEHEPRAIGCAQFRWVRPEDLNAYPFPPADAALLDRLAGGASLG